MNPKLSEWLNLGVRWFHVFAAILWIGQTYLFTWLDRQLTREEAAADGAGPGEVWLIHSGGFYVVEKRKTPGTRKLHWFRWEAALTWISGLALLTIVYWIPSGMVDPGVREISKATAVAIGAGVLIAGWVVYDLLARSALSRSDLLFAAVSYVAIVGVTFGLTHVLSGRAAYIHVGAMFGTIMAANVWMRILPAQRRMIAAAAAGRPPDETLAAQAKLRSKHNTFMVVPTVFIMISNHFAAATYGDEYNWAILSALILVGWVAAMLIRKA